MTTRILSRGVVAAGALLVLAAPAALHAQRRAPLEPGTRVRVRAPQVLERRLTGSVVRVAGDSLVVARRGGEVVALPLEAVEWLEVSRGKSRVLGAVWGAGIGVAGGMLAGGASCRLIGDDCMNVEAGGFLAAMLGGIAGGGMGVIAGSVIGDERWRAVRVPSGCAPSASLSPAPGGGVALSVSVVTP